jgi:hypothetical protein
VSGDGHVEGLPAQHRALGDLAHAGTPAQACQVTAGSVSVMLGRHLGLERHGHHGRDTLTEWLYTAGEFIYAPTSLTIGCQSPVPRPTATIGEIRGTEMRRH